MLSIAAQHNCTMTTDVCGILEYLSNIFKHVTKCCNWENIKVGSPSLSGKELHLTAASGSMALNDSVCRTPLKFFSVSA